MKINKTKALANATYQVYQELEPASCTGFSQAAFTDNFKPLTLAGSAMCRGNSNESTSGYAKVFFQAEILKSPH